MVQVGRVVACGAHHFLHRPGEVGGKEVVVLDAASGGRGAVASDAEHRRTHPAQAAFQADAGLAVAC